MSFKRGLKAIGFLLIAIGAFIVIIQPFSTTGAVIDLSAAISRIWFFVGLGMIAIGGALFFLGKTSKGDFYTLRPLDKIIEEAGREKDVVFVLDSSGAIDYKRDIEKLIDRYDGRVYVPKRIMEELKGNRELTEKIKHYKNIKQIDPNDDSKNYKILRRLAKDTLGKTKKHKDYIILKRIIGEEIVPKGVTDKELTNYENKIEDEINLRLRKLNKDTTKENQLWLLKKEYRVNKGDVDVLTTALRNARNKNKTKILAQDTHIRDAVSILKVNYPRLEHYLDYIDYREYQ